MNKLCTLEEVRDLILDGKSMLISGDEDILSNLPAGNWIGGTIPYFMTDEGGMIDRNRLFINVIPEFISKMKLKIYSADNINDVYSDAYDKGFSTIIIPATTPIHLDFALKASQFENFLKVPLIGWISGVHLDDLGTIAPKVFYGPKKKILTDKAVVMHFALPKGKIADLDIINVFEPDLSSPVIIFPEDGFSASTCTVDNKEINFARYLTDNKIDIKLPLVADYNGTMINTSFQAVNEELGNVDFYAPVFEGITYHSAASVKDYIKDFKQRLSDMDNNDNVLFAFNCVLNFLYCELEGKKTGHITGPITFGEVAYQLMNQTLVYLTIT